MKTFIHRLIRHIDNLILKRRHPELQPAFRITSHLTCRERITLFTLAKEAPVSVEIGSYLGASACCIAAARMSAGFGRVLCIDTWANHAMTEGQRDTWQMFHDNTRPYRDQIVPIRGFSTEVVDQVRRHASSIDLLFIDGDHSYEGVIGDWNAYRELLHPGSIVAFHDYGWAEGVQRVVHEHVAPLVGESQQLPNLWWGRIRTSH